MPKPIRELIIFFKRGQYLTLYVSHGLNPELLLMLFTNFMTQALLSSYLPNLLYTIQARN